MSILSLDFYRQDDVITIAKELLGKWLFTSFDDKITGGIISETESYKGHEDRACHAFGNRRTKRTEVMFHEGGIAYIYLCYGIHSLFNVVTNKKEIPHAILIRAIIPKEGILTMLKRRNKQHLDSTLTSGPGALTQALGIHFKHNGHPLHSPPIWIEDRNIKILEKEIKTTARIGVEYAKEDALLPYRFLLAKEP